MNIGKVSSLSFSRVIAAAGSKDDINSLKEWLDNAGFKEGREYCMDDATLLYKENHTGGLCDQAVNQKGQDVVFITTGKNVDDVKFMQHGWGSLNGISKHISDFADLATVSVNSIVKKVRLDFKNKDKNNK